MGKEKHDWPAIRREFFESNYSEVESFFRVKFGRCDSNMRLHAKGWGAEKRQWRNEEVQLALQNLKEDRAAVVAKTLDKLFTIGVREVERMAAGKMHVKNWVRLWEVIRTEAGLPKSISHNINDNTNIDLKTARESLLDRVNKSTNKK